MNKLINCPACGRPVSCNAAACPACAEPISRATANTGRINMRDPVHFIGVVASAIVLLFLLAICWEAAANIIEDHKTTRLRERNQQKALIERQRAAGAAWSAQ